MYGKQLDAEFTALGASVQQFTFRQPAEIVRAAEAAPESVLLVHAEPAFFGSDYGFMDVLDSARENAGAKVVFCCHWFSPAFAERWSPHVDAFVTHREYADLSGSCRVVVIPLGCSTYVPSRDRLDMRVKYNLPLDSTIMTTLGFLAKWKRFPVAVNEVMKRLQGTKKMFLQILTPFPHHGDVDRQMPEMLRVLSRYATPYYFSTDFRPDTELLDRVYLSDLGFLFHGQDTGSVSAATKTFVSARTPLVVTKSTHASDLSGGVLRVNDLDPASFAEVVVAAATTPSFLNGLRSEMESEYERVNMAAVARQYETLFDDLTGVTHHE